MLEEWFLQLKKSENHRTRESPSSFQRLKSSVLKSSPCHSIRVNWHYLANIPCQIFFNELIWDTPRGSGNALMSRKSFHILGNGFSSNSALSPAVTKVNPSLVTISATLGSAAVLGERSKHSLQPVFNLSLPVNPDIFPTCAPDYKWPGSATERAGGDDQPVCVLGFQFTPDTERGSSDRIKPSTLY